jgi:carbon storage regulator
MLILTRRPGERVVIGDEVLVTVMSVSGHTVRLGIDAPAGVSIYREEIWLAVKEENRAAAEAADAASLPPTGAQPRTGSPPQGASEPVGGAERQTPSEPRTGAPRGPSSPARSDEES